VSDAPATSGSVTVPRRGSTRWGRLLIVAVIVIAGVVIGLAVSSGSPASTRHSGSVDVLYAGSFLDIMQQSIDPAFHTATGYTVQGVSDDSMSLASEIKGGTQVGDVFISAAPKADEALAGSANGNWVSSYQTFGQSDLVLGYNPNSSFASDLKSEPWYDVVGDAGFHLGRTDPATDPKGVLAVDALDEAATAHNLPGLRTLATSTSNVYAETTLVGELQSGQIDGGFFYEVEAKAANLKTVPLTGTSLAAMYTVAELRDAPHSAAATAFINFLLGPQGRQILATYGVTPLVPAVTHPVS
jgi:molybdate/tungstate transport system substrate-binding protein